MAKEICISSTPHETRLAILEDDQLAEIYYERENEYTLAGSIYNGRVTRVLPGMQSAFVDLGLERDAFLYVTDFMELEDSEDSDELEKAAATGANQAPREVRHTNGNGRPAPQQPRSDQPSDRGSRAPREHRPVEESTTETTEAPALTSESAASPSPDEQEGGSGRRWRGRRHRRGARGQSNAPEAQSTDSVLQITPESDEQHEEVEIRASVQPRESRTDDRPARPQRGTAPEPVPFVLPGESLRKYGGAPADDTPRAAEPPAPVRPSGFAKPSTLVEAPLAWDGSGLLPGESISRHRNRPAEPESEPSQDLAPAHHEAEIQASHPLEEVEYVEETQESDLDVPRSEPDFEAEQQEAEFQGRDDDEMVATESTNPEVAVAPLEAEPDPDSDDPIPDASASHNIDPLPPHNFRLFGFGKKKEEEPAPEEKSQTAPIAVSSYAPGAGHIEEEVIEGEEFDAVHPRHRKPVEHDLDEYEEETLPTSLRTGELGEMLQEAHLDHKIQLNFDEKSVEDESFDEDEEEEGATTEAQPGDASGQPRRDRGQRGRGRGGRSAAPQQGNRRGGPTRRSMQTSDLPIISDLLKPGQEILVQIAKEPIAKKGARITSHIALPGRFLVFMPTVTHIGVSRKIASDEERQRLKRILVHERGESSGGFIVRTAAEGASEEDLRADLRFLMNLWNDIKQRSDSSKSPALIYHDLSLIERILRDQVSSNFANIWVDSEADYERIVRFLNRFSPSLVRRVKLYTKQVPLFEHFGIQDEISKALRSKVWLKSGGSIVINQTEALVAIDINTGKYVGKSARLEDTIVKTNLDAVPEIVRQIRLRDLGGIIVIDFIDMDERKNRYRVLAALEEALKADRAPTKVLQFNDFGLVAITRKRVKQSLERTLSVPCATCQATGMVKSPTTVCNEIYTELRKMKKHFEGADVLLRVHPETVKVLKQNNASWLVEFEELTAKNILVKSDATLHPEQFDIQG
jgi:ribonuclease G